VLFCAPVCVVPVDTFAGVAVIIFAFTQSIDGDFGKNIKIEVIHQISKTAIHATISGCAFGIFFNFFILSMMVFHSVAKSDS
jgi:hypothetical protein